MTREQLQAWLDAYVDAWRSYEPEAIGALFSEDATYAYEPWDEPLRGRDAIVEGWLGDRDEPGSWEARYEPLMIAGDQAVATGESRYAEGRTFANLFVLRFAADGRCAGLVEWYKEQPR